MFSSKTVLVRHSAALKIQKCFRDWKAVEVERSKVREKFCNTFGDHCQKVDGQCFSPESDFFWQLLFFFNTNRSGDFTILVATCRLFRQFVADSGDIVGFFSGNCYSSKHAIVNSRVKQLVYICLQAVHHNRNLLKDQLVMSAEHSGFPLVILLEMVASLIRPELPWICKIVDHLFQRKVFAVLRDILLAGMLIIKTPVTRGSISSVEHVVHLIVSHIGHHSCTRLSADPCTCLSADPWWSFSLQILSIPFLWKHFPYLKEVFAIEGVSEHFVDRMALYKHGDAFVLPDDVSHEFPGHACLLGNFIEFAGVALSRSNCTLGMARDFAVVTTYLLEALPALKLTVGEYSMPVENDMNIGRQISRALDPHFHENLVNALFRYTPGVNSSDRGELSDEEVAAVGAICAFLHVTFSILPLERTMTVLAYRTELVHVLWKYINRCHYHQSWPYFSPPYLPGGGCITGWLLPLAVFCPVYMHMLMIVDDEEFYNQEKPLSLNDTKCLIIVLRQALWELLWVIPGNAPYLQNSATTFSYNEKLSADVINNKVRTVTSECLSQLQDWNNRRCFTSSSDFHAEEAVGESFFSQVVNGNTKANDVLKQAPFLVPFTSRVKIFDSQLAAARVRNDLRTPFSGLKLRIRRDRIVDDAFSQLSVLSDEELRGMIQVTFVNEFGEEEAGIDGGGIFKEFMENIIRAAFDVDRGLFKETSDRLIYPNPGSGLSDKQHLKIFHFLGSLVGKAMFEGILVELPFATFFLSKLKQKYNYFNDLPSLDGELYRNLKFLKNYEGDVSLLELYFVTMKNDFEMKIEEELLPGGRKMRVTKNNVITYIHLISNRRLNFEIRLQCLHFLRGFQQLIQKEWIDMFNECEIQLLISGSHEDMDFDDLRSNTHYAGGYHCDDSVIQMFWEVIKNFSLEHQKKFLKFVTGCSRGPLLGFKYLHPKFCIQRAAAAPVNATEEDLDLLPTSATCFNLLKFPPYKSVEQMAMKLMYAINAEAGFHFS